MTLGLPSVLLPFITYTMRSNIPALLRSYTMHNIPNALIVYTMYTSYVYCTVQLPLITYTMCVILAPAVHYCMCDLYNEQIGTFRSLSIQLCEIQYVAVGS